MILQVLIGIVASSFLEWTIHKHILHELGKKKVSIFSFHWGVHHRNARKNDFYDKGVSGRELVGILVICLLASPICFILPFTYCIMLLHAMIYLVVHNLAHRSPSLAKTFLPWHYDHHMGKDQNQNWCVVHPLADYIMKTRKKYEYE